MCIRDSSLSHRIRWFDWFSRSNQRWISVWFLIVQSTLNLYPALGYAVRCSMGYVSWWATYLVGYISCGLGVVCRKYTWARGKPRRGIHARLASTWPCLGLPRCLGCCPHPSSDACSACLGPFWPHVYSRLSGLHSLWATSFVGCLFLGLCIYLIFHYFPLEKKI